MDKIRIMLDAGHYGKYNRSSVVPTYYESEMNFKLVNYLKEELDRYGFETGLVRKDNTKDMDVYTRGTKAKGYDLFLSIHSNACSTESVDYPVVYRAHGNLNNADVLALRLAKVIENTMKTKQAGKTATRQGTNGGEYYGVLRGARDVGCKLFYIVEHSFHSNIRATNWLLIDTNLKQLAINEAQVIAEYYGYSLIDKPVTKVDDTVSNTTIKIGDTVKLKESALQWDKGNIKDSYKDKEYKVKSIDAKGRTVLTINGTVMYAVNRNDIYIPGENKVDKVIVDEYKVKVEIKNLWIRAGAGTGNATKGYIPPGVYTIVETKAGKGSTKGWGRLKSGVGWISLDFTKNV